eukprot:scaffold227783_cov21-Tisochrysis_lutea.AAC.4
MTPLFRVVVSPQQIQSQTTQLKCMSWMTQETLHCLKKAALEDGTNIKTATHSTPPHLAGRLDKVTDDGLALAQLSHGERAQLVQLHDRRHRREDEAGIQLLACGAHHR